MNTKQILAAMAVVAAMSASSAMAQGTPPAAPAAAPVAAAQGSKDKVQNDQKFADFKAKALSRLEKRAADVQKKQACVQAATDGKSLKACSPKKGKWSKRGEKSFKSRGADKSDTGAAPVKN